MDMIIFINPKYYDLLLKKEDGLDYFGVSYYLAGRYVHLYDDNCDFGLQAVFYFTDAYRVAGANVCTAHRI